MAAWINPDTGMAFNPPGGNSMGSKDWMGLGLTGLGALGGLMSYDNPSEGAMPYLNQIKDTMTPYYDPYINAGKQALPTLQSQYQQLLSDPTALLRSIGGQYQQSPGYQFQVDQMTRGANQAAAAAGMSGSPAD